MRSALQRMVLAIAAFAIASSTASGAWLKPCATAKLIASWKHQGYWRTAAIEDLPRSVDGHKVRYVGKLHAGGQTYKIYFDESTDPDTATHHGHQDLAVTTAAGKFLGIYDISDIEAEPVRTQGAEILFPPRKDDSGRSYRDRIHFGAKGPPQEIPLLFGYDLELSTPAGFREDFPDLKPWPPRGPRIAAYCRR